MFPNLELKLIAQFSYSFSPFQCSHLLNFTVNKGKRKRGKTGRESNRKFDLRKNKNHSITIATRSIYITNKLAALTLTELTEFTNNVESMRH